ncbi:MAG: type II secretion system protein N [Woeseiaceae bacterium]|nr:type II secretion system protein N [Woeseiaceae bacterium]
MIRSKGGLIAIGVATLILGLALKLPAQVVAHWLAPSEIVIGGLEGTAWNGSAREASIDGIYVREVKWTLNAMQILTGALSYEIEATPVSGFFESEVRIGLDGTISMLKLRATLPMSLFSAAIGIRGLQGQANLALDRLELLDGLAVVADGAVNIVDLIVPLVGYDSLGGYEIELFTQNNGISASITDNNGVLDLAGSLQIRNDRSFEFLGLVVPKPETPAAIRRQLRFLPPANDQGQQELRLEGVL